MLSATNALSQVSAAEQTNSRDRSAAVALTARLRVGAGLIAVIHSLASGFLGFRGIMALAIVPLCAVPFLRK